MCLLQANKVPGERGSVVLEPLTFVFPHHNARGCGRLVPYCGRMIFYIGITNNFRKGNEKFPNETGERVATIRS